MALIKMIVRMMTEIQRILKLSVGQVKKTPCTDCIHEKQSRKEAEPELRIERNGADYTCRNNEDSENNGSDSKRSRMGRAVGTLADVNKVGSK